MSVFQLYSRNGIRYANVKTDLEKRKRVSLQSTKKKEALKRAIFGVQIRILWDSQF